MRVTIFDYGAGNLHSLAKAFALADVDVVIETDPLRAIRTDVLALPGVGAFGQAASRLAPARDAMRDALRDGLPALGICLGMQLLFDASDESDGEGLGLIPGRVRRLHTSRNPHIGWNDMECDVRDPLLERSGLTCAYYANGYVCDPVDKSVTSAWSSHDGVRFPAIVRAGATSGVQFHPEKSSADGVRFLRAFIESVR